MDQPPPYVKPHFGIKAGDVLKMGKDKDLEEKERYGETLLTVIKEALIRSCREGYIIVAFPVTQIRSSQAVFDNNNVYYPVNLNDGSYTLCNPPIAEGMTDVLAKSLIEYVSENIIKDGFKVCGGVEYLSYPTLYESVSFPEYYESKYKGKLPCLYPYKFRRYKFDKDLDKWALLGISWTSTISIVETMQRFIRNTELKTDTTNFSKNREVTRDLNIKSYNEASCCIL